MAAETTDPRIPPRDRVVLRYLLERHVEERGDQVFVKFVNGDEWTYADMLDRTKRYAAGFRKLGVQQGDHVLSFLPSSPEAIEVWCGLNYLGAVYIPANPAYKGNLLAHVVKNSDARIVVTHHELAERFADIELTTLEHIIHLHGEGPDVSGLCRHNSSLFTNTPVNEADLKPERPIEPWDTQGVWYTSGTTGPSKGALSSYMHAYEMFGPETWPFITAADRFMINLPLYHLGGTGLFNCMLHRGGSIAFVDRYQTGPFWQQVRDTSSTSVFLLGAMAAFLEAQPPSPDDKNHPMRVMFMVPIVDDVPAFAERFGVEVRTIFNMTEICTPIISGPTPKLPGTCGRLREGASVRLVDENDCEVPIGEVGEFIVRCETPWGMHHGYLNMPEATAKAWRNGWFHTGDAGRMDEEGNYYFVDRIKDAIRRRGEYISSLELEIELCAHPNVAAAAVVATKSEYAEDEVLAYLQPAEGKTIDFVDVIEFLRPRVAYFAIPRYFEIVEQFPLTPTEKIRKVEMREWGLRESTWDREEAGIVIKAERIGK